MFAIYLRKSRADLEAEQRGQGETLSRHRATLLDLADRRSLPIGEIYSEIVSGDTIAGRPQMQRLLDDVSAGRWEGVLCMDIDRLGRGDSIDQGIILRAFELSGTLIITPGQTYDLASGGADAEFAEMKQAFARFEYRAIKRRMWAGRCASAKEGNWQSKAPYGYSRVRLDDGSWSLVPHPQQAEIVRLIFNLFIHGTDNVPYGLNRICTYLDGLGVLPATGDRWRTSSVAQILDSPVYIGKIRWCAHKTRSRKYSDNEDFVVDGKHPALISDSDFQLAHERRHQTAAPTREVQNPLAGLVRCSHCGAMMLRGVNSSKSGKPVVHYLRCTTRGCPGKSTILSDVESAMLDTLSSWLDEARRPDSPSAPAEDPADAQRRQLTLQLSNLKKQRARLMDLVEQGAYTIDEYKERSVVLSDRITSTEDAIAALDATPSRASIMRALAPRLQHVLASYPSATPAERNALLRTVVSRAVYTKIAPRSRWHPEVTTFVLDVFPLV